MYANDLKSSSFIVQLAKNSLFLVNSATLGKIRDLFIYLSPIFAFSVNPEAWSRSAFVPVSIHSMSSSEMGIKCCRKIRHNHHRFINIPNLATIRPWQISFDCLCYWIWNISVHCIRFYLSVRCWTSNGLFFINSGKCFYTLEWLQVTDSNCVNVIFAYRERSTLQLSAIDAIDFQERMPNVEKE